MRRRFVSDGVRFRESPGPRDRSSDAAEAAQPAVEIAEPPRRRMSRSELAREAREIDRAKRIRARIESLAAVSAVVAKREGRW